MRKIYNNLSLDEIEEKIFQLSNNWIYAANRKFCLELQTDIRFMERPEYIVLDTETNGLPLNYNVPITDSYNWPRLVQCSYLEVGIEETFVKGIEPKENVRESSFIIKPKGFKISSESTAIHGISQTEALAKGDELFYVLVSLGRTLNDYGNADKKIIVGHNVEYDIKVLSAEYHRLGLENPFANATIIDTMKESVNYCKIPGSHGYKWPKLQELYKFLFGKEFVGAHNALADVNATNECYRELKRRGIIKE